MAAHQNGAPLLLPFYLLSNVSITVSQQVDELTPASPGARPSHIINAPKKSCNSPSKNEDDHIIAGSSVPSLPNSSSLEKCRNWLMSGQQETSIPAKVKGLVSYSMSPSVDSSGTFDQSPQKKRSHLLKRKLFSEEDDGSRKIVLGYPFTNIEHRPESFPVSSKGSQLAMNSPGSPSGSKIKQSSAYCGYNSAPLVYDDPLGSDHRDNSATNLPVLEVFEMDKSDAEVEVLPEIETSEVLFQEVEVGPKNMDTIILDLDMTSEIPVDDPEIGMDHIVLVVPAADNQLPHEVSSHDKPPKKRNNQLKAPPVGRKRTTNKSSWIKNQAKSAHQSGAAYVASSGKEVRAKSIGLPCKASCRLSCSRSIPQEIREKMFNDFYKTKTQVEKWHYIRSLVRTRNPTRRNNADDVKRQQRQYHFMSNGELIEVCQTMFLNTLSISDFVVRTALQRNLISPERRGGQRKSRLVPESVLNSVRDHIANFPRVASHYCRVDTSFEYLETDVKSVANMHRLYVEWMRSKGEDTIASKRQYEDEFNSKHRIKFFKPRKDLCDLCVAHDLTNKDTSTEEQQKLYEDHILSKDLANSLAALDKSSYGSNKDPTVVLCHMDLQKVLLLPKTNASEAYYKMKLTVLNFTIYDISAGQGHCFVWNETIGKKDANSISSFVLSFFNQQEGKKHQSFDVNAGTRSLPIFAYNIMFKDLCSL